MKRIEEQWNDHRQKMICAAAGRVQIGETRPLSMTALMPYFLS
jgi:ribosomal protein S17